jgi:hypothetical protein
MILRAVTYLTLSAVLESFPILVTMDMDVVETPAVKKVLTVALRLRERPPAVKQTKYAVMDGVSSSLHVHLS